MVGSVLRNPGAKREGLGVFRGVGGLVGAREHGAGPMLGPHGVAALAGGGDLAVAVRSHWGFQVAGPARWGFQVAGSAPQGHP